MQYRREIDGLRAVAVVPVILFHAGVQAFGGGFVGVDVFFVISGYLITTIIAADLRDGRFSLAQFYERRARRILPALFFVIACCLPLAFRWMAPDELTSFGWSIAAVVLFVSNILFWRESGYFASAAELKPLLHTWSLAVEEQFYLVFPLLLLLLWRKRAWLVPALIGIIVISLAASEWGWRYAPTANFYLAFSRAWELLAGACCGLWLLHRKTQPSHNLASAAGLAMILAAVFAFDRQTPFPSLHALLPVLGTVLVVLFAGEGTWVRRLLGLRSFVAIGLISYSAYLWHQPLFAFARIRAVGDPAPQLMLGLAALSILLAWLSWRFVERPFRAGPGSIIQRRRHVFWWSAAAGALLLATGTTLVVGQGLPQRLAPNGRSFAEGFSADHLQPNFGLDPACDSQYRPHAACQSAPQPTALLWGDSFAMHLAPALRASQAAIAFEQKTKSQCAPLVGVAVIGSVTPWRECLRYNDHVLEHLRAEPGIRLVIISSSFYLLSDGSPLYVRDGRAVTSGQQALVQERLKATVDAVRRLGKQVVIVSPPPLTGEDLGRCETRRRLFGIKNDACAFTRHEFDPRIAGTFAMLRRVSNEVPVLFLDDLLCEKKRCAATIGNVPLYRDADHLSVPGSIEFGRRRNVAGQIERLARPR